MLKKPLISCHFSIFNQNIIYINFMKIFDFYIAFIFYARRKISNKFLKLNIFFSNKSINIINFKDPILFFILSSNLIFSNSVLAQTKTAPVDAGSIQQQFDSGRSTKIIPQRDPITWGGSAVSPDSDDQTRVQVNEFIFKGNTLIGNEALNQTLQSDKNNHLNFKQLQLAVEKVIKAYKDAGWVAFAFLPVQDISSGNVSIQIVEVVMGELFININSKKPLNANLIRKTFSKNQAKGEFLNLKNLDRALLLLSDLPGVQVNGSLGELSQKNNSRDVILELSDSSLQTGEVSLDNSGSRSTGAERVTANLNFNNLSGHFDLLSLLLMKSEGINYLRSEVNLPISNNGLRIGAYNSLLNYRVVSPEFLDANSIGDAKVQGLNLSYPLLRSFKSNLSSNTFIERKSFDNKVMGSLESKYKSYIFSTGLLGNSSDDWGGNNSGSINLVFGQLDLDGSPSKARDAIGLNTAGAFNKFRYSFSRQQSISSLWSSNVSINGQLANKNLDSSEKFTLGGDMGVRAYPSSEGLGSQGRVINFEMRWRATSTSTLIGFYDWGRVTLLRDHASATALNTYSLKGIGIGLNSQFENGGRIKLSWSRRIGNNPNPSSLGQDQDGSLQKNRVWLSATLPVSF
jgi:hemolysin activation/secretion protein